MGRGSGGATIEVVGGSRLSSTVAFGIIYGEFLNAYESPYLNVASSDSGFYINFASRMRNIFKNHLVSLVDDMGGVNFAPNSHNPRA